MSVHTMLIKGGTIVSESGFRKGDLVISGNVIKAQGEPGFFNDLKVNEVLDASGKLVLPGLIDPHVHFIAPFMGTQTIHDYYSGTVAALYGGVTTVISFSTQPKGGSLMENLALHEASAQDKALIDWSMHAILLDATPQTLSEIPELINAGVPTYKCFTTYKHADRMMDDEGLLAVLEATATHNGMLMVHCETDSILNYNTKRLLDNGDIDYKFFPQSRPRSAENESIRRIVALMKEVEAPVYIVHTSTAESVGIIQQAREQGLQIHGETCTHYLVLTEEVYTRENGGLFICSPPLRRQQDINALWLAAADGRIEVVSSDDAGLPTDDRIRVAEGRFDKMPNGMPGIEPRLVMLYTEGVAKGRIDLPRLVQLTSTNPARLFGLFPRKGHLSPGADADVVIYDPDVTWTISAAKHHMNTDFSPFEGREAIGRVETVISRGEIVLRDNQILAKLGRGERLIRKL
jgi:dihydropyrimidinase